MPCMGMSTAPALPVTCGFTDLEASSGNPFRYVFHVSLFRRLSYAGRPPVKSAILVTSLTLAHHSKMHAMLIQGSSIKVRTFEEREPAAQWLGVSVKLLTA